MTEHEQHEQESRVTYDREAVETILGFEIAPTFEPHIINKDESLKLTADYWTLNGSTDKLDLSRDQMQEVFTDYLSNRCAQLLASITLREREILVRIMGTEAVEQAETMRSLEQHPDLRALMGLVEVGEDETEEDEPSTDEAVLGLLEFDTQSFDYNETEYQVAKAVETGTTLSEFRFELDGFYTMYPRAYNDDGSIAEVYVNAYKYHNGRPRASASAVDLNVYKAAQDGGEDEQKAVEYQQALIAFNASMNGQQPVEAPTLSQWRRNMSERNRRLDVLSKLDDTRLRSAVLNHVGLKELFDEKDDGSDGYGEWGL